MQSDDKKDSDGAHPDGEGNGKSHSAVLVEHSHEIAQADRTEHQDYADSPPEQTKRLRWLVKRVNGLLLVQILLFLGTIAQAGFLYQSNRLTLDALIQSDQQNEQVLALAELSLAAAELANERANELTGDALEQTRLSNQMTQEQFQIAERPWLTRGPTPDVTVGPPGRDTLLAFVLTNTGRSPALNVRGRGCVLFRETAIVPNASECQQIAYQTTAVVGTDEDYLLGAIHSFTTRQTERLIARELRLWAFIGAEYADQFGNEYESDFCNVFENNGRKWAQCESGDRVR